MPLMCPLTLTLRRRCRRWVLGRRSQPNSTCPTAPAAASAADCPLKTKLQLQVVQQIQFLELMSLRLLQRSMAAARHSAIPVTGSFVSVPTARPCSSTSRLMGPLSPSTSFALATTRTPRQQRSAAAICPARRADAFRDVVALLSLPPTTLQDGAIQFFANGTECDLTGRNRSATVKYSCRPGSPLQLVSVIEPATCVYEFSVVSNAFCPEPAPAPTVLCASVDPEPAAPAREPFVDRAIWYGTYECQGEQRFQLELLGQRAGERPDELQLLGNISFWHGNVFGSFLTHGKYDSTTGRVGFRPGKWQVQPVGFIPVHLAGQLSATQNIFSGVIPECNNGAFRMRQNATLAPKRPQGIPPELWFEKENTAPASDSDADDDLATSDAGDRMADASDAGGAAPLDFSEILRKSDSLDNAFELDVLKLMEMVNQVAEQAQNGEDAGAGGNNGAAELDGGERVEMQLSNKAIEQLLKEVLEEAEAEDDDDDDDDDNDDSDNVDDDDDASEDAASRTKSKVDIAGGKKARKRLAKAQSVAGSTDTEIDLEAFEKMANNLLRAVAQVVGELVDEPAESDPAALEKARFVDARVDKACHVDFGCARDSPHVWLAETPKPSSIACRRAMMAGHR
eukprot:m.42530 g.42530  ORF g.42530 m.42530 type:complete len:625 (+) comp6097_c0_seq1:137-2011(+)